MIIGKNEMSPELIEKIKNSVSSNGKDEEESAIYDGPILLSNTYTAYLCNSVVWEEAMGLIARKSSLDYQTFILRVINMWSTFRLFFNPDFIAHIKKYIDKDYSALRKGLDEHHAVRFATFCLEAVGTLKHPCFDKLFNEYMCYINEKKENKA